MAGVPLAGTDWIPGRGGDVMLGVSVRDARVTLPRRLSPEIAACSATLREFADAASPIPGSKRRGMTSERAVALVESTG